MKDLDTSSPERFQETAETYREKFYNDVIGRFEDELLPPDPKSRKVFDEPEFTGYEVKLDVWPDVFAYGILLVPKNIPEGEKRPVVVCQHGLEGRPSVRGRPERRERLLPPVRGAIGQARVRDLRPSKSRTSSRTGSAPFSARRTRSAKPSFPSSSPSTSKSPTG